EPVRTPEPPGTPGNPREPLGPPGNPKEPSSPIFDDVRQRLSLLPIGLDVNDVAITPDGKNAIVIAGAAGQSNLYAYSLDELAADRPVARQLSTTPGGKSSPQVTPDNREVFYL